MAGIFVQLTRMTKILKTSGLRDRVQIFQKNFQKFVVKCAVKFFRKINPRKMVSQADFDFGYRNENRNQLENTFFVGGFEK